MLPDASVSYSLTMSLISSIERRSPAEGGEREMRGGAEGDKMEEIYVYDRKCRGR